MTSKYVIKCDDCKQTIGHTDSLRESAEGGRCDLCVLRASSSLPQADRIAIIQRQASQLDSQRMGRIIDQWETHCTDAGHTPVSKGGSATYTAPRAISDYWRCLVDGCRHEEGC